MNRARNDVDRLTGPELELLEGTPLDADLEQEPAGRTEMVSSLISWNCSDRAWPCSTWSTLPQYFPSTRANGFPTPTACSPGVREQPNRTSAFRQPPDERPTEPSPSHDFERPGRSW